jgi:hypothetical protein
VRLVPGARAPQTILAPDGVEDLGVATNYVDVTRPTGSPSYGFRALGLLVVLEPYGWVIEIGLVVALVWWYRRWRRARLARRQIPPAP